MRVQWVERTRLALFEADEQASFAVDHHFGNAAHGAADDGRAARHRFEVDDAERLVDGRTDEDRGMAVQLDNVLARQHLANPYDAAVLALGIRDCLLHLLRDLGCVRRTSAQHDLGRWIEHRYRPYQVHDALLAG